MEAVRTFNNELSGLYEVKPPISRAKMATVTKCAIKAIKFYKHVVQSVEKFIQKCKPEYKVPGLYVIDSVVRQSRHQFGSQKDVFAPRFTKNIIATFQNLFKCPGDERSKIVRVLNLWQKNEVFPSEIIQPLLDLAADPTKPSLIAAAQAAVDGVMAAAGKSSATHVHQNPNHPSHHGGGGHHQPAPGAAAGAQEPAAAAAPKDSNSSSQEEGLSQQAAESMLATQNDMLNTVTQLLQQTDSSNTSLSAQQQQLQQLQLLQQQLIRQTQLMQQPTGAPIIDGNLLAQIQALTNQLLSKTDAKTETGERFNKKLLDFDYGESDDEDDRRQHQGDTNMAGNVATILSDTSLMQQIHQVSKNIQNNDAMRTELDEQEQRRRVLEQQQAEFDQQIAQGMPPPPPFGSGSGGPPASEENYKEEGEYEEELQDEDFRDHQQMRDRDDRRDRRRRSRDRSRTPKRRRRSRSRSRDRRRRSRSRDRHRRSRSKDKEREKQKEKERDRKKKALPAMKESHLSVCTTTIWIGHLNKFTQEEELRGELERYGPVTNISMVPPRGCAYVVMTNRKDAYKAIDRLRGYKMNGSALKTAWAQSTGMREADYKEGWDVESGVKYIPWDRLPIDLSSFLDGAILDPDSLPEHLKGIPTEKSKLEEQGGMAAGDGASQMGQVGGAGNQQAHMPGPSLLGMGPQPGMMPPNMQGMMPGMVMPMQRPLVPGMPPQPMGMNHGAPPQIMPGAPPQLPGMPGAPVPAGMNPLSIANTSTTAGPPTLQNVVVSGAVPNSPAVAARPGFPPPGAPGPTRFGFNPNLPPPGFRLPPPGFGMRPMMPGMPNSAPPDTPPKLGDEASRLDGPKQPEMVWPPDSNEKDDDEEEEDMSGEKARFEGAPNLPVPPGTVEQPGLRMMGPRPPGGFPPPMDGPWAAMMRMGGPRPMRPPMGMMGGENPEMFNNMPPMMGPRGPMFMGNRMGMPGSPGFPRLPMGNIRAPVSLLDLDIKPPEKFEGETFEKEDEKEEDVENQDFDEPKQDNEENVEDSGYPNNKWKPKPANEENVQEDSAGGYPHNKWKNVQERLYRDDPSDRTPERSRDRNSDRHRDRDRDRERDRDRSDSRNRDRDDDRSRGRDRDRNWDRDDDHYRDRRDSRDRDRDRSRGDRDRDRDWRKRDEHRGRDRKEERERTRPSRWSNADEVTNENENSAENIENMEIPETTVAPVEEPPQASEVSDENPIKPQLEVSETMEFSVSGDEGEIIENNEGEIIENNEGEIIENIVDNSGNTGGNLPADDLETSVEEPALVTEEAPANSDEPATSNLEEPTTMETSTIESDDIKPVEDPPVDSCQEDVQNTVNNEVEPSIEEDSGFNIQSAENEVVEDAPSSNGPVITEAVDPSNKLETIRQDETSSPSPIKSNSIENKENEETVELEEGEIAS